MTAAQLAYAIGCIFVGGIVRGYSGFGFSLLAISALSLILPPAAIIPPVFLLELAASLHLLPGAWQDVQWRPLRWLALGCFAGTPAGVYALAHVPAAPMTIALSLFVLAAAALLVRGYAPAREPGAAGTFATGMASGLCNGGFGMGGPPVVLFFFGSPAGARAGRASLIAFFVLTDAMGLAWQGSMGLLNRDTLWHAAAMLPPMLAGVWIGNRAFGQADPVAFRRRVLYLLMALAMVSAARALLSLDPRA